MIFFMLMMGGCGSRFGSERPKQYIEIDGRPVFSYILEKCNTLDFVDEIIVVSNDRWENYVREWICNLKVEKCRRVVRGGKNRSESVKNGLLSITKEASEDDIILIHDATHPYLYIKDIQNLITAVTEYGAATLSQAQFDTMYMINDKGFMEKVIPREYVVSGASPEAFRYDIISDIYFHSSEEELEKMTSAGAFILQKGITMKVIPMKGLNLKITWPEDMELFKKLVHTYFFQRKD